MAEEEIIEHDALMPRGAERLGAMARAACWMAGQVGTMPFSGFAETLIALEIADRRLRHDSQP